MVFGITNSVNESAVVCQSNVTWTTDKWQLIAITIQRNTLGDSSSPHAATTILYIDGEAVLSAITPIPSYASHSYCYLSNSRDSATGTNATLYSPFDGAVDSLLLYNTALPPQSILAHFLVDPPAYFELNFNLDPHINFVTNSATSYSLYSWLDYDPLDAPLPNTYNHHQGMVELVQSAARYEWIDLNQPTGPNSVGVAVPIVGGESGSAAYANRPGLEF